jgi:mono/diheme cytochrome c family protein
VRKEKLQHILIGTALGAAVVVPLGAFAFVESGLFNVGATSPHTKLTTWITHETMIHSVRRHAAGIEAPRRISGRQLLDGFCLYETHCVACHGAAAVAREQWVGGLEPSPPYLLDATSTWTAPQLFWIVKNGVKMTGMPSWRDSLSDGQIWSIVGLLEAMRELPPQTYVAWRSRRMCAGFSGPWTAPEPPSTPRRGRARPTGATGG